MIEAGCTGRILYNQQDQRTSLPTATAQVPARKSFGGKVNGQSIIPNGTPWAVYEALVRLAQALEHAVLFPLVGRFRATSDSRGEETAGG